MENLDAGKEAEIRANREAALSIELDVMSAAFAKLQAGVLKRKFHAEPGMSELMEFAVAQVAQFQANALSQIVNPRNEAAQNCAVLYVALVNEVVRGVTDLIEHHVDEP